jgi:hypothetical protein
MATMIEKDGMDAFLRSISLLRHEAVIEAAAQLAEVIPSDASGY